MDVYQAASLLPFRKSKHVLRVSDQEEPCCALAHGKKDLTPQVAQLPVLEGRHRREGRATATQLSQELSHQRDTAAGN